MLVLVLDNGPYETAVVMSTEQEYQEWLDCLDAPGPERRFQWVLVSKDYVKENAK
jgi:hypothetical protein